MYSHVCRIILKKHFFFFIITAINHDYVGNVPPTDEWALGEKNRQEVPLYTPPTLEVSLFFRQCLKGNGHLSTALCLGVPGSQVIPAEIMRLVAGSISTTGMLKWMVPRACYDGGGLTSRDYLQYDRSVDLAHTEPCAVVNDQGVFRWDAVQVQVSGSHKKGVSRP